MASRGDINLLEVQPQLYNEWSIISFDNSLDHTGTFTKIKSSECNDDGIYPVIDQGEKYISGYIDDPELIYKGELPVIIFGDHTRNVKYVDFEFAAGADGTKILSTIKQIDSKFFYFYLKALAIPSLGYSRHYSILKQINVPLPPLAEQERIAEKLDALFGQLDSVRGAMSRIPTLLANLRQQILTHAVTGKLTAHKGNIHILANHLQSIKYGTSKKSDYDISDGIPVLRIPNIKDGKIDITDLKYSLFDPKEYQLLRLSKGDVLVIRSNGSISLVGQSAIVDNNCDGFCYAGYLIRLRFNNDILPDFINYSFRSEFVRKQIVDLAHSTSGVNNINAQQIQNLSFVYFEKPEQEEIVNRVQSLFEKLDSIEQRYQMLKTKLENLPQAILHKAFKGELVEQLPSDGNATDILREIEQLKKSLKKK